MTSNFREIGKTTLSTCLTIEKNVTILEATIFKYSDGDIYKYNDLIFQTVGAITNGYKLSDIHRDIKAGNIGWDDPIYDNYKVSQKEDDDFIENPFQVEEGALQCSKCGSKRTISYSKQMRSADEPASTIATCINCKNKWVYSG
jgi:DNA-directed RNA polymerase subunit M/transcription elongation factor TFIIS